MKQKILNKKEVKKIMLVIDQQWGCLPNLDYVFMLKEENVYIANRDVFDFDTSKVRVNSLGMYFGELRNDEFRLSIEGSRLIGKFAKKNVVELDKENIREWFLGNDIEYSGDCKGFVLIKFGDDFCGCGKVKEGKILNHVPKARRVSVI